MPAPYDGRVNAGVSVVIAPEPVQHFEPSDRRAVLAAWSASALNRQESV